jgi:hypothetical protein
VSDDMTAANSGEAAGASGVIPASSSDSDAPEVVLRASAVSKRFRGLLGVNNAALVFP